MKRYGPILTFLIIPWLAQGDSPAIQKLPIPPYPVAAFKDHAEGCVLLEVKFDAEGKVESCRVATSSGSGLLDSAAVNFAGSHWVSKDLAGQTRQVPVTYALPDQYSHSRIPDASPMPNLLSKGDPERKIAVRIDFAGDGSVGKVDVLKSSGKRAFDQVVTGWIKGHWHSRMRAGQTLDLPFDFKPPTEAK